MRDYYDFSKAVKNPYADQLKAGAAIIVRHNLPGSGRVYTCTRDLPNTSPSREDEYHVFHTWEETKAWLMEEK